MATRLYNTQTCTQWQTPEGGALPGRIPKVRRPTGLSEPQAQSALQRPLQVPSEHPVPLRA